MEGYKIEKALDEFEKRNGYSFISKAILIENFMEILKKELLNLGTHNMKINTNILS